MVARMYASQEVEMVLESIVVCQGVTVKRIEQVGALGNALYKMQLHLFFLTHTTLSRSLITATKCVWGGNLSYTIYPGTLQTR